MMSELLLTHSDCEPECASVPSHFNDSLFILWDKATDSDICNYFETLDSLVEHFLIDLPFCPIFWKMT